MKAHLLIDTNLDALFRVRARELRGDQRRRHRRRRPRPNQRPPHRAHLAAGTATGTRIATGTGIATGISTATGMSVPARGSRTSQSLLSTVAIAQRLQPHQCRVHADQRRVAHPERGAGLGHGQARVGELWDGAPMEQRMKRPISTNK